MSAPSSEVLSPTVSQPEGATPRSPRPRIRSESSVARPHHSSKVSSSFSALSDDALCSMITVGVASEQGSRKTMEDQHTAKATDAIPFFGVYDGHGGTQCAEFLRANLHGLVVDHPLVRTDTERALREAIAEAEKRFMAKCREEKIESGSTAALAVIVKGQLVTANVGDSEIVLCRNGAPLLLSTKHQLGSNESEMERVKNCGGRIYHSRVGHPKFNPAYVSLGVSRAIGDAGFKLEEYTDGKTSGVIADAETKSIALQQEDEFLLIACDGLYDVMSYQACVDYCRELASSGVPSQEISEAIVGEALRLGSTDNVTVLFVQLQPQSSASPKSQPSLGAASKEGSQNPAPESEKTDG